MAARTAACHCGQLRLEVAGDPFAVTDGNRKRIARDFQTKLPTVTGGSPGGHRRNLTKRRSPLLPTRRGGQVTFPIIRIHRGEMPVTIGVFIDPAPRTGTWSTTHSVMPTHHFC